MLNYRLGFLDLNWIKKIYVKIKLIHVLYMIGGMKPWKFT
jgi:hypothetical protein